MGMRSFRVEDLCVFDCAAKQRLLNRRLAECRKTIAIGHTAVKSGSKYYFITHDCPFSPKLALSGLRP